MIETFHFTEDIEIQRLLNGMWQVSGAHGDIDPRHALTDMVAYHDVGFQTWDLADHYGPAEDFIGEYFEQLRKREMFGEVADAVAFTTWVPQPEKMSRKIVDSAVDVSRHRMGVECIDMLQFHWWDYYNNQYLVAMENLAELCDAGKIRYLGLTNFNTRHIKSIVREGIRIVSNQVQYSVIDRRPEVKMIDYCRENNIWLLTYGTLGGGLISEQYLNQPEPQANELDTASKRKYKQMIDVWGGWELFQEMLQTLQSIADKHNVSLANVATRFILDRPQVAGVIVGVRLGRSEHRDDNVRVFSFSLDDEDIAQIESVSEKSRNLFSWIGDCGDEYRRKP